MKNYPTLLFDLDGTISDPREGVMLSLTHTLKEFGREPLPPEIMTRFIGPPLSESFEKICNFPPETAREAVLVYRKHHRSGGLFINRMYDGIPEVLAKLRGAGKRLAVATSKPEPFARALLDKFGISGYFEFIGGAEIDDTRSKKAEVVRYVLENMKVYNPCEALMIGDRLHDVQGALENGVDCAGVLYGYGTREELTGAGAKYIFEKVGDLLELLKAD